jgi:ATP synthase subunit 6
LLLNLTSLITYNLTISGHIIFTLYLSFTFFFGFVIISFLNFQLIFFLFFIPKNVPILLKILLTVIELISYLIRPFSLAIRLFANMLAGHTLLHIFSTFYFYIMYNYPFLFIIPLVICISVFVLEIGVAFIQAYVFYILLIIYLNDSFTTH